MQSGLAVRTVIALTAILAAIWVLLPTFLGKEYQDTLEKHAEWAAMEEPYDPPEPWPWWVDYLPNRKIQEGLDLQGGIDLTLEVEVKEAVLSSVQRDIMSLKKSAEIDKVDIASVRREKGEPRLLIEAGPTGNLDSVQQLLRRRFNYYTYVGSKDEEGKSWFVFEMSAEKQADIEKHAVEQAQQTIENRINETGVKEPSITLKGTSGIDIQLPGETNIEDAVRTVGTTARLEFLLVDEDADMDAVLASIKEAQAAMTPDTFLDDKELTEWLQTNGKLAQDRILRWEYKKELRGQKNVDVRMRPYVLKDEVLLTGDDVNDAKSQQHSNTGEWYVSLEFKPAGEEIFSRVTGENVGKRFAIMLDDQVKSAPNIREKISGGASITMGAGNVDEQIKAAGQLSLYLRSGALPAPVSVGEVRTVGATLGQQAVDEGIKGTLLGGLIVLIFAAGYYRFSGVLADLTLGVNVLLVLALLASLGATLTLPGICGIALSIGMAVDCNIIIYERIREELRAGKTVAHAIEAGFDRAFIAVFDAHVTNLLAGVVLYSYGTGPLKGFAVTLMIGIFTTLFTGVFLSRTLLQLSIVGKRSTSLSI